ncbi:MAG: SiaB family protein kinase [Methyloceanibacter sp.]
MHARELFDIRTVLRNQGIMFTYSGPVTETVLSGVGEAIKQKLVLDDADTKTLRSVFAVFVEQMQNMIYYSAEKVPSSATKSSLSGMRYGILTIGREGDDYVIHAGNLIAHSDVGQLRERLSKIRSMNKEELRAVRKERLRGAPEEGSKGAGLGLMEIARRASKPIEFDFTDVDYENAFFSIKASV